MKDLYSKLSPVKVLDPVSLTNGGSMSTVVDLAGFNSAAVVWHCGASGAADGTDYWDVTLTHADDNGTGSAGPYVAVEAKDILGVVPTAAGIVFKMDDHATKDSQIYFCGYVGGKRFLKVALVEEGAGPTMVQSAMVIKGHAELPLV